VSAEGGLSEFVCVCNKDAVHVRVHEWQAVDRGLTTSN
jgi:hypothetical protein